MRTLQHIPVGVFNAWLISESPVAGAVFFAAFIVYQLDECLHIKDQAWKDLKGYLWGFAIAAGLFPLR
jgi:hypothetical protein